MAGDEVPEQPGVRGGEGVGSGRRKSAEFIQKSQLFEEEKVRGGFGRGRGITGSRLSGEAQICF